MADCHIQKAASVWKAHFLSPSLVSNKYSTAAIPMALKASSVLSVSTDYLKHAAICKQVTYKDYILCKRPACMQRSGSNLLWTVGRAVWREVTELSWKEAVC